MKTSIAVNSYPGLLTSFIPLVISIPPLLDLALSVPGVSKDCELDDECKLGKSDLVGVFEVIDPSVKPMVLLLVLRLVNGSPVPETGDENSLASIVPGIVPPLSIT